MSTPSPLVLITGALTGIGRATALAVAREGAATGVRINAIGPGSVQTDRLDRFTGGSAAAQDGFLDSLPTHPASNPKEIAESIVFARQRPGALPHGAAPARRWLFTAQ